MPIAHVSISVDLNSIKNDVAAKQRRNAKENDRRRRGELIRTTSGIGDRVNPDFAKQPKAARIEEDLLGMIFLHNEYLTRQVDGCALREDEMPTDLGRRLLAFVRDRLAEGAFQFGMLNESFSLDEVARVSQMIAERSELSVNSEESYDTYVRALRAEGEKTTTDKELTLEELLAKKRGRNTSST